MTYRVAGWLFFRLLGLVYLFAFGSLAVQIVGLVGPGGILPAGIGDGVLRAVCGAGMALAVLEFAGLAPAPALVGLWALYLWLSRVCGEFLAYQWDTLLLETGLIAAVVAPWRLRDRWRDAPDLPRLGRALLWWLLFRLMFGSGVIKFASGDPTWRSFTALSYHFWTQPLPTPLAWYASRLPAWTLRALTAGALAAELVLPFALLPRVPRAARVAACVGLAGLQIGIGITGNYAFFNLLSCALCLLMLDDGALERIVPARLRAIATQVVPSRMAPLHLGILVAFAIVTLPVSAGRLAGSAGIVLAPLPGLAELSALVAPLRSVNAYGLFAVMTTERPEIVIEGSNDARTWQTYEFKYKPTAVTRPLPWVAPHQPRLDWQMWFAALGRWEGEPWLWAFCRRLLDGSPDVLALLARNPFPDAPPRYLRAELYRYRFSTFAERGETGAWWVRERVGPYSPTLERAPAP